MNAISAIKLPRSTADLVDQLGTLKAQVAELTQLEKILKDALAAKGEGEYEGKIFRATVAFSNRGSLDMDAVRGKLSAQFLSAHTTYCEVTTVRVVGRMRK